MSKLNCRTRRLHLEFLEPRQCLAASVGWDGPGRGAAALTYYVGNVPSSVGLTPTQVESAVKTALDAWSAAAAVKFTKTTVPNQLDSIDIRFVAIDGPGGALAQAYFPDDVNSARLAGDIEIDVAEKWEIGNSRGAAAFDLTQVVTHELGHSLGLDHSSIAGSVMNDSVSPTQSFSRLSAADVDAILTLYAPAGSSVAPTNTTNNTAIGTPVATPRTPWNRGWFNHRFGRATAATVPAADSVGGNSPVSPANACSDNSDNDLTSWWESLARERSGTRSGRPPLAGRDSRFASSSRWPT